MIQAIVYGLISGFSLLFGAATCLYFKISSRNIARVMAFGGGVLICALTFGLMEEAFGHGGFDAVILGFLLGGTVFIAGDWLITAKGGRRHRRKPLREPKVKAEGGKEITLGAMLDGIPESVALGIAIANGLTTGILMAAAIALSNFPEGMSSVEGLKKEGFSNKKIYLMWFLVATLTATLTVVSFSFLKSLDLNTIGIIEAFAAGAILAMLADTMIPEAYEEGGFTIGMLTVLGFLTAFLISRL